MKPGAMPLNHPLSPQPLERPCAMPEDWHTRVDRALRKGTPPTIRGSWRGGVPAVMPVPSEFLPQIVITTSPPLAKATNPDAAADAALGEQVEALVVAHQAREGVLEALEKARAYAPIFRRDRGGPRRGGYTCEMHKATLPHQCPGGCSMRKAWEEHPLNVARAAVGAAKTVGLSKSLREVLDMLR